MSSSQQSEPPDTSSHTPVPAPQVIRISRLSLVGVGMLFIGVAFPAASWPAAFGWLVLIPIIAAVWVLRVRTVVSFDGLAIRRLFGSEFVAWENVRGIHFPNRRWARVVLTDKSEKSLPLVRFDRLPVLAAASGGRITDPYAAAAEADRTAEKEQTADADREAEPGASTS
ncbi:MULTISPECIES: PH domain-containing protein [unclassified Rhodococcus (in: high G+C Gram-positive bacteria)]|uniref:PH domain-containing protein n=1 Tax=Rhodococcus sp. 114MFTsu3.1 TaxID=1172184 RepID=UPI00048569FB|nr:MULTISPECIES: PH domain-containing protein [unclassified Rhodococcus (in: high G+C Gram-positive bacteria)]